MRYAFHQVTARRCFSRVLAAAALILVFAPLDAAERASARLLTIGNSFAHDATSFLPEISRAGGKQLVLFHANLGGASLERHASHLISPNEASGPVDPRPYKALTNPITGEIRDFSLPEALRICPWDFVTIQQVSIQSFRPETYHPYADQLISTVKSNAPQAEILIHETWAYREDHAIFQKGDGFTPLAMHEGLRAAYHQFSAETGFRVIPVGDAFYAARQTPRWRFKEDKTFDSLNAKPGELPDQRTSLNLGWYWKPNDGPQGSTLILDAIHSNAAGQYLGSCVFYLVLFDAERVPAGYVPPALLDADAKKLRAIAEKVVATERDRARSLTAPEIPADAAR